MSDTPKFPAACAFHPTTRVVEAAEYVRVCEYAVALTAPARELLYLYDWRPKLAAQESAALDENGGNAEDRKEVKRLLREYGERKKAGWIALRAAIAAPSVAQDTYTAPVPAGYTHALDCAYKASVRNHCTCGYVDKEGA